MPAGLSAIERRVAAFLAGSAAVHLAIVGLLGAIPPDAATLTLDLAAEGNRLVRFESKAREDKRVEPDKGSGDATDQGEGSPDAQMAPGEEGAAGTTSSNANGKMAIKDRNRDNAISRADAITEARSAGFLGHLEGISEFASPEGFADYSSGDAAIDAYGRIDGEGFGPGGGNFGMGRRGFGPGGGGTVWTGNYRTIGWPGTGDDVGGSRLPGLRNRTHRAHAPVVEIKNARVEGELSKDIIRRYIKRQLPRIQHCYQRTLLVNSGVEGTVNTSFVISAQGAVLSSTASGIGDAELEGCIAGVVGSIQFPRPEGNGLVKVSYPFRLRTPGG
jgi:hypothetical protein